MKYLTTATFFISTGRCATQWFACLLEQYFRQEAVVTHEPVKAAYHPKDNLRGSDALAIADNPMVGQHLAEIEDTLANGMSYVETGWPCYAAMPLMSARFGERTRFVHIVRNPVHVAMSLATHRVYQRDDWIADAAIDPFDSGVVQKDLASGWQDMCEYEKALFWWTEINMYALEMQKQLSESEFLSIRYEDLFGSPGQPDLLAKVLDFMGFAHSAAMDAKLEQRVDSYSLRTPGIDWQLIFRYPRTCELARKFGYSLDGLSDQDLWQRYGHAKPRIVNRFRGAMRRLFMRNGGRA